jgi:alkylation response protein AidB-like acyl-CoA dehydrogenase
VIEGLLPGFAPAGPSLLDEPLTDRLLGEEERAVRGRVRDVVAKDVAPRAAEWDRTGEFAGDGYHALASAGLAGLIFPPAYGGNGSSTLAYAVAMEEIAAACGSTALIYMTQTHAGYPILIAGTEEQRRRYLPALCAGTAYGALAISEPDAGSDVAAMRTTARPDGDGGYILDGGKTFITTGDRADVIVCFATVDRSAGRRGITAFLVPGDAPGLTRGRTLAKLGMHGSSTAELFFENLRLPASARLGAEGEGWSLSMRSVVKSRISAGAQGLGLARGAYAVALGWARATGALGRGGRQDVEFRLADLRARIASARALLYSVAAQVDEDEEAAAAGIAMMKFTCTDLALAAADEVTDLLGPLGDLVETGAERRLREAKVTQIYDGTNQVQRLLLGRDTARRVEQGAIPAGSEGTSAVLAAGRGKPGCREEAP